MVKSILFAMTAMAFMGLATVTVYWYVESWLSIGFTLCAFYMMFCAESSAREYRRKIEWARFDRMMARKFNLEKF